MVDEVSTRRSRFQPGTPICLADHQGWTFPAPTSDADSALACARAEYLGLIQAVQESEDQNERRLAELALAIFLIGQNYRLRSSDLADLFTFPPRSQELAESQHAFELLATEHILWLAEHVEYPRPALSYGTPRRPLGRRFLSWLRSHGLFRKALPPSQKGEALS